VILVVNKFKLRARARAGYGTEAKITRDEYVAEITPKISFDVMEEEEDEDQ
jgi:hypothetical protein